MLSWELLRGRADDQGYGSKAALFAVAIQLEDAAPGEIEDHLHDVLDVRPGELPPETRALVRSILTAPGTSSSLTHSWAASDAGIARVARAAGPSVTTGVDPGHPDR